MKAKELIDILFIRPTDKLLLQLFRYGFVGGVAFVADYGSLWLLTELANVNYLYSAAIAFVIGLTVNYLLSISWVFSRNRTHSAWMEFVVFALVGVVGLALNEIIIYGCTEGIGLHYMLSKVISTVVVFFWNFFARKLLLFRSSK